MKPESLDVLRRLHTLCEDLLTNPPPPEANNDGNLAEMQALVSRIQKNEATADLDTLLTADETTLLRSGLVIHVIKAVRQRTGLGLRESKELVERGGDILGLRDPGAQWGSTWKIPLK